MALHEGQGLSARTPPLATLAHRVVPAQAVAALARPGPGWLRNTYTPLLPRAHSRVHSQPL